MGAIPQVVVRRRAPGRGIGQPAVGRQYRPFKGWAFPPTDYVGPDDPRETDDLSTLPKGENNALQMQFVYGYCGRRVRQNLFYNADGKVVYHVAALGVVYDAQHHAQLTFSGHDDDITALAMHPDRVRVVTGQTATTPSRAPTAARRAAPSGSSRRPTTSAR